LTQKLIIHFLLTKCKSKQLDCISTNGNVKINQRLYLLQGGKDLKTKIKSKIQLYGIALGQAISDYNSQTITLSEFPFPLDNARLIKISN
jgi:hypothetical protein